MDNLQPVKSDYVVVPGVNDVAGALVYWRLTGGTSRTGIAAAWEMAGLDPKLLPKAARAETALRLAALDLAKPGRLIRPVKPEWAVLTEWKEKDSAGVEILHARHDFRIRLGDDPNHPVIVDMLATSDVHTRREIDHAVNASFSRYLDEMNDTSGWLVKLGDTCKAIAMRDTGGFYFIPREYLPRWEAYVRCVRLATQHQVFQIPCLKTDEAVAAILDAVKTKLETEAAALETDLSDLGAKAAATRVSKAEAILKTAQEYERLLGVSLSAFTTRIETIQANLVEVTLAASEEVAS